MADEPQPPRLGEAVAELRHEMARGGDYAVVDIAWLRVVLDRIEAVDGPVGFRHVGYFAPHGFDGNGWLANVEAYVKAEDYDRHSHYAADGPWAENARLRTALAGLLGFAETWSVEFYGDDGDLLTEEEDAAFVAARAALAEGEPHG